MLKKKEAMVWQYIAKNDISNGMSNKKFCNEMVKKKPMMEWQKGNK